MNHLSTCRPLTRGDRGEKIYEEDRLIFLNILGRVVTCEIAEHYGLHPSTVGVIVRRFKNSQFGT